MEMCRWVILACMSLCLLAAPGAAKKKLESITEVKRVAWCPVNPMFVYVGLFKLFAV